MDDVTFLTKDTECSALPCKLDCLLVLHKENDSENLGKQVSENKVWEDDPFVVLQAKDLCHDHHENWTQCKAHTQHCRQRYNSPQYHRECCSHHCV